MRIAGGRRRATVGTGTPGRTGHQPACEHVYISNICLHIPVTQLVHRDKRRVSEAYTRSDHASDLASAERAQQQLYLTHADGQLRYLDVPVRHHCADDRTQSHVQGCRDHHCTHYPHRQRCLRVLHLSMHATNPHYGDLKTPEKCGTEVSEFWRTVCHKRVVGECMHAQILLVCMRMKWQVWTKIARWTMHGQSPLMWRAIAVSTTAFHS